MGSVKLDKIKKSLNSKKEGKNEKGIAAYRARMDWKVAEILCSIRKVELDAVNNALKTHAAKFSALHKESSGLKNKWEYKNRLLVQAKNLARTKWHNATRERSKKSRVWEAAFDELSNP